MKYAADLELARQCAAGDETAWERFVREYRPILYRAAHVLDPTGGARELADSLYADLYGVSSSDGEKRSLFQYFHGRSSLATWLRAVLAQRHVDRLRAQRRLEPLLDDDEGCYESARDGARSGAGAAEPAVVDRSRYLALLGGALGRAVGRLAARDRLRLACYYLQELTLSQTGQLLTEHEATVSRQLARTRQVIREAIERDLRDRSALTEAQIAECFACAAEDPGPIDLTEILAEPVRKESAAGHS